MEGNNAPDVGGGDGSNPSFPGGSVASLLFPPMASSPLQASSGSFQPSASLPPGPDSAAAGGAVTVRAKGAAEDRSEGSGEGDGTSAAVQPPARAALSLKQSLDAAIVSAAARDAKKAAAAAAAAETEKVSTKAKSSVRARRRCGGGGGGGGCGGGRKKIKSKGRTGVGGRDVDAGKKATTAAAGGTASAVTPRRPARNLRRPRQESAKSTSPVATAAGAAATAPDLPVAPPVSGVSLSAGMELIPGFEDTIDSHFMTALLQRGSDTQPGVSSASVSASAFASAESQVLAANNGGGGDPGGEEVVGFGSNPELSLGFLDALLVGYDTQPSELNAADAADAKGTPGNSSESAVPVVLKAAADDGGSADGAGVSIARDAGGDAAPSLPPPPGQASAPPLLPTRDILCPAAVAVAAAAAGATLSSFRSSRHPARSSPAAASHPSSVSLSAAPVAGGSGVAAAAAAVAASPAAASPCGESRTTRVELATASDPGVAKLSTRRKTDKPKRTATATVTVTAITAAAAATAAAAPRRASSDAPPGEEKAAQLADPRAVEPASTIQTTKTLPKEKAMEPQQEGAGAVPASALPRASAGTTRGRVGAAVDEAMQTPAVRRDEVTDRSKQPQAATQPQAKPAPPPLPPLPPPPPPPVVPSRTGSSFSGNAAVVTEGMGTGGFVGQPAGSARPPPVAAEAVRGRSPPRQLPRKVSLRFSPRDESTEGKVSEHGYLPFQKLTAPLSKPLEAVFKFMVKKWSEVAYSDLNSIRIVFDADAGDTGVPTAAASTPALSQPPPPPPADRTVVWGAELSKRPLLDLVSALPGPALDRVCEEQALSLSYTFLTGPVGPPPSRGSAPWDAAPEQEPAAAVRQTLTPTATPRPPPPVVAPTTMGRRQAVVVPRLGALGCPFSIPGVGGGAVAGGSAAAAAAAAAAATAAAAAMVAARGMAWKAPVMVPPRPPPPPGNFASGSQAMANAIAAAAATGGGTAGAGALPNNAPRPSRGGGKGGVQGDTLANATLKKHYKNISRMLQRQGIASPPPLTHFLPGGLFARMHTAAVAGAIGNAAEAAQQALPGRVEVPARASAPGSSAPAAVRRGRQDRIGEKQKKQDPPSPDSEKGFQDGAVDSGGGGGDGGFEDFGGDASNEVGDDEARGDKASGALMGEETCMALFGGNGVELLVDPSPPGGTGGAVAGVDERAGAKTAKPDAAGPVQSSPPLNGGMTATPAAAAAATTTKPAGAISVGVLEKVKEVSPLTDPPLRRSTSTAVTAPARSAGAPASPPPADSTLMGEETCMALFGGSGVELLVDPSTSPTEAGEAAAAEEAEEEGGEQKRAGLTSASETPQQLGGRGAGEDKDSGRSPAPPALPQKSLPPHTVAAAAAAAVAEAGGGASAQPVLPARTVGAVVPSVKAAGVKSSVDGNVPPDSKLVLPSRLDSSAPVVCAGGSTRDNRVEQRTTQAVVQPKSGTSKPLPTTPPGTASAPSTARTAAASPATQEPLPQTSASVSSTPVETAARSPGSSPLPAPRPVCKVGSLPTRAKFGRPRSPTVPAAATAAAASASSTTRAPEPADEGPARSSGAGTGKTPAGLGQRLPPSPEVPMAPAAAVKPGESGSSACFRRQPAPEPAVAAAAAATTDSAGCVVADSEAEVVTPVNGIAPEVAASGSSSCDGGGGGGGGGAATVTAPPTPRPAHHSVGTAGTAAEAAAAGGAAEDSPQSHPGGSRKLTRSQSNGGDPASSFEGSGGGLSSRPAEAGGGKGSEKPRTHTCCRVVAAAPSEGATPPPPPPPPSPVVSRAAEKNSLVKRRRSGSGEGASEGPGRKRVAPTTAAPGATPSPAPQQQQQQQQQQQLVATPAADAPSVLAASPAAVARPFAFASADRAFKGRSPPLLLRVGTDPPRPIADEGTSAKGKRPFAGEIAADMAVVATANQPGCELESVFSPAAPNGARGATSTAPGAREGAAVAGSAAGDGASPAVCAAVASPPPAKARRFAFAATAAAAAKKGDRGELLRYGERPTTTSGDADGRGATASLGTVAPAAPVSNGPFLRSASPPGGDVEGYDPAGGLMSPPRPPPVAVAAREIDSASLSLSMSREEVQAGYSEAWSSVPSCLWDGAALLDVGEQTAGEGPVTRWLALPNAEPSLGGSVAAATPPPAPAIVAAASVAGPVASGEDCGFGRGEEAAPDTTPQCPSAAPLEGLTQREEKKSSWASFCAAFTSSRGSAAPTAASATSPGPRAAGEARSLPTLIRLGRSMTKGVSPVGDDDKPAGKGDGAGVESAAAAAMGNGSKASAARVAAAAGAPASAPAAAATAAESTLTASGAVRSQSLAVDCNDGGGKDSMSSETLRGSRRKRDGGAGTSGDGGLGCNSDAGGEEAAAAAAAATVAAVAPTALPKRRSKKKGRIAPTFVSTLQPDSFGTLTTAFSSNRRV
ncbi:unnamed protein product [Ectocarpus sp. CCAP 1310/34]|nr:unnamed protein product [Ectocarpus sp. CCAP 1310/34]